MSRIVMHLVHSSHNNRWHLTESGSTLASFDTKQEAIEDGRQRGHAFQSRDCDAQLVVHREDGSIETEHTYGHDPERFPG